MSKILSTFALFFAFFFSNAQETSYVSIKDMIKTDSISLSYKGEILIEKINHDKFPMVRTDKKSLAYKGEISKLKKDLKKFPKIRTDEKSLAYKGEFLNKNTEKNESSNEKPSSSNTQKLKKQ